MISTYTENPIIFNILFENGKLIPQITALDFVEPIEEGWIPELPDETKGRRFYDKLLHAIEDLERRISRFEEKDAYKKPEVIVVGNEKGANLDWQYYDFKNKVVEAKERVKTIRLGFRDKYYVKAPAIPLRLKSGNLFPPKESFRTKKDFSSKGVRENYKDRLFQKI